MEHRQLKILGAIIDAFLRDAIPVGSRQVLEEGHFELPSATIRSEMARLEEAGFVIQPHTSSGRVPTARAYRLFVDQIRQAEALTEKALHDLELLRRQQLKKAKEKLYEIVSLLAAVNDSVSFCTLPDQRGVFYIGIGNIMKKPEFVADPLAATRVVEVLENDLESLLAELELKEDEVTVTIGEENFLQEFQGCSLLSFPYSYKGFRGVMGLLGPTRMNYPYSIASLKAAARMMTAS